jgi:predicted dehydrogenase
MNETTSLKEGRYRVGLVGAGRQGTFFGRAFATNPATEVVAACNRSQDTLDLFCKRFGAVGYTDYRQMLRDERLDIVATVVPVKPNPEIVIASARAGVRGILSEKPIAGRLVDLDRMVAACDEAGVPYQAGNVDRVRPQNWAAREAIIQGAIGEVRSINCYTQIVQGGCNALTWAKMYALGQFIRGKSGRDADAEWVVGKTAGDPFSDGDEGLNGIGGFIHFGNGIEMTVHVNASARRGVEVVGSEGVFSGDGRHLRFWRKTAESGDDVFGGMKEVFGLVPSVPTEETVVSPDGWLEPDSRIVDTVQSLIDAIDLGMEPRCSGRDQQQAFEITVALRESARRGHAPVHLPLAQELREQAMWPVPYRWTSKRELYGGQWYMQEMQRHKKDYE